MVLVQIHTSLHFERSIFDKMTYIFCFIFLQTLISAISPHDIYARYVGEKLHEKCWVILIWFC